MRHLGSFLLAVVLAPIVYLLAGLGVSAFQQAASRGVDERPMAAILALTTLAVGGAVYAVLVMARLSPVGPALAGFLFLAMPAWPLVNPATYVQMLDFLGLSGLGVFLAIPLIATLASPRRWSQYDPQPAQVAYHQPPVHQYPDDGARRAMAEPVTEQMPDVAPPTLHYPKAATAPAPASPPPAPASPPPAPASPPPAPAEAPKQEAPKQEAPKPELPQEPSGGDPTVRIDPDTVKPA